MESSEKKISSLRSKIQDFDKSPKKFSSEYLNLVKDIDAARKALTRLLEQQGKLSSRKNATSGDYSRMKREVDAARQSLENLKRQQADYDSGAVPGKWADPADNKAYQDIHGRLLDEEKNLAELKRRFAGGITTLPFLGMADGLARIASAAGKAAVALGGFVKKAASSALRGAANIIKGIGASLAGIVGRIAGAGSAVGSFGSKIMSLAKSVFVFNVLSNGLNALKRNAVDAFSSYLRYDAPLRNSLSSLRSSFSMIGAQMASAFAPIISSVVPILATLINWAVTAANAVAAFIAAITGKSSYKVAVAGLGDVAGGAGGAGDAMSGAAGAAKELKKELRDFDELNVISPDTGSGGGGGGGGGGGAGGGGGGITYTDADIASPIADFAEKVKEAWENADFTEIGTIIGTKLKNALDSIPWDQIQATAAKVGKSLATLINGAVEVEGLGTSIGNTIAQALNTAIIGIDEFASNLHWDSVGQFIADGLNSMMTNIKWDRALHAASAIGTGLATALNNIITPETLSNVGTTLANSLNTVVTGAYSFLRTANFTQYGTSLATGINSAVSGANWTLIGSTIGTALQGAMDTAVSFLRSFNVSGAIRAIEQLFNGIGSQVNFQSGASQIASALASVLNEAITPGNLSAVGRTIGSAVSVAAGTAHTFLKEADFQQYGQSIGSLISSAITTTNWNEVGRAIGAALQSAIDFARGIVSRINLDSVKEALKALFEGMAEEVDLGEAARLLFAALGTWLIANAATGIASATLATIGTSIAEAIGTAIVTGISSVGLGGVLVAVGLALVAALTLPAILEWLAKVPWDEIGNSISDAFSETIDSIRDLAIQIGVELLPGWEDKIQDWFDQNRDTEEVVLKVSLEYDASQKIDGLYGTDQGIPWEEYSTQTKINFIGHIVGFENEIPADDAVLDNMRAAILECYYKTGELPTLDGVMAIVDYMQEHNGEMPTVETLAEITGTSIAPTLADVELNADAHVKEVITSELDQTSIDATANAVSMNDNIAQEDKKIENASAEVDSITVAPGGFDLLWENANQTWEEYSTKTKFSVLASITGMQNDIPEDEMYLDGLRATIIDYQTKTGEYPTLDSIAEMIWWEQNFETWPTFDADGNIIRANVAQGVEAEIDSVGEVTDLEDKIPKEKKKITDLTVEMQDFFKLPNMTVSFETMDFDRQVEVVAQLVDMDQSELKKLGKDKVTDLFGEIVDCVTKYGYIPEVDANGNIVETKIGKNLLPASLDAKGEINQVTASKNLPKPSVATQGDLTSLDQSKLSADAKKIAATAVTSAISWTSNASKALAVAAQTGSVGWAKGANTILGVLAQTAGVGWSKGANTILGVLAQTGAVGWGKKANKILGVLAQTAGVGWSKKRNKVLGVSAQTGSIGWSKKANKDLGVYGKTPSISWSSTATDDNKKLNVKAKAISVTQDYTPEIKVKARIIGGNGGHMSETATGGVFHNGLFSKIAQFARGGSPTHGTMFVAGEAGAEIVGNIGGRTEILNQSQLASAIFAAVKGGIYATAGLITNSVNGTNVSCANAIIGTLGNLMATMDTVQDRYATQFSAQTDVNRWNAMNAAVSAVRMEQQGRPAWVSELMDRLDSVEYVFTAKLDGKQVFRSTVTQNDLYRQQTGKSALA